MQKKKVSTETSIRTVKDVEAVTAGIRLLWDSLNTALLALPVRCLNNDLSHCASGVATRSFQRLITLHNRVTPIVVSNGRLRKTKAAADYRIAINTERIVDYARRILNLPRLTDGLRQLAENQLDMRLKDAAKDVDSVLSTLKKELA